MLKCLKTNRKRITEVRLSEKRVANMKKPGLGFLPSASGVVLEPRSALKVGAELPTAQTDRGM